MGTRKTIFVLLIILLFPFIGIAGEEQSIQLVPGPETAEPVSMDQDLRTLDQLGPIVNTRRVNELKPWFIEEKERQARLMKGPVLDPVLEPALEAPFAMPATIQNFAGLDFANYGAGWPPDTNGDVGPNHYIQVVNTSIGIYNKSGTPLTRVTFDTFFNTATAPCNAANNGDPVALYDALSGRWLIADFAWTNTQSGPYYMCIAVSKTADPVAGGWWLYTFRADDAAHPWLNDYPKIGAWQDGFYMSSNMFDCLNSSCSSASYQGVRVWALNRDDLISGAPLRSLLADLGTSTWSLFPANYRGTAPAAGTPGIFLSADPINLTSTILTMRKLTVTDWSVPSGSISGDINITTPSYTMFLNSIPESGGEALDSLGDRLMVQVQYRNIGGTESLWATHAVTSGSVAGLRWYEIRNLSSNPPTVFQSGTYQPDSNHRWMQSLAVDKFGNMAIGYSVSSSSMSPAIRYAGRLVGDAAGTLAQGEATLQAGGGSQSGGFNRWGDYSLMTVDPVDDCTFWYTTEYYSATGSNWQTRIGSFQFPACAAPSVPALLTPADGAVTNDNTPTFDWQDSTGSPTQYQIQVDNNNDFSSPEIDSTPAVSTFTPPGALADGTYSWRVRASNSAGNTSAYSTVRTFTVDTTPPSVPVLVSPADLSTTADSTPAFDWDDSTGSPTQYQIQVDNNNDFSSPEIDTTTPASSHTAGGALGDATYFWRVRAGDAVNNFSAYSTARSFTIDTTGPSVPLLLSPADNATIGDPTPDFDWSDSTGSPTSYQIQVDNNNDFSSPEIDTTSATSAHTAGIPLAEGVYFWRVRASDALSNFSAYSGSFTFTVNTCMFCDDFNDNVTDSSWTYSKPAWTESGGSLTGSPTKRKAVAVASPVFLGCDDCTVETSMLTEGGFANKLWLYGWWVDSSNTMELLMKEENDRWVFKQRVGGSAVVKAKANKTILPNTAYIVRVVYNGVNFQVFVDDMVTPLITLVPQGTPPAGTIGYAVKSTIGHFDYIAVN